MATVEQQFYNIRLFCVVHAVSRSSVYREIKAGRLKRVKLGRKTLISREDAEAWRCGLERSSIQSSNGSDAEDASSGGAG